MKKPTNHLSLSVFVEYVFVGSTNQVMLIAACFFLLLFKTPLLTAVKSNYYFNTYELTTTEGTLKQVSTIIRDDGASVGELTFEFTDEFGRSIQNNSYNSFHNFTAGQVVEVEYVILNPLYSRIVGSKYHEHSSFNLLIFMFCIISCLIPQLYKLYVGNMKYNQLRRTQLAEATFIRYEKTKLEQKDEPIFLAIFNIETTDDKKTCTVGIKTTRRKDLRKRRSYSALYMLERPDDSIVLTMNNDNISLNKSGKIVGSRKSILYLILPLAFFAIAVFG